MSRTVSTSREFSPGGPPSRLCHLVFPPTGHLRRRPRWPVADCQPHNLSSEERFQGPRADQGVYPTNYKAFGSQVALGNSTGLPRMAEELRCVRHSR